MASVEEEDLLEIESLKGESILENISSSSDEDPHSKSDEQDALDYLINEYIDSPKIKYQMRDYRQNLME